MDAVVTGMAVAALVADGLLAGLSLDKVIVQLPARRRMGVAGYAAYARSADLANGVAFYALAGVSAAVLTVAAFGVAAGRGAPAAVTGLLGTAAVLSVLHSAATGRAAPTMFQIGRAGDTPAALEPLLTRFARWSAAARSCRPQRSSWWPSRSAWEPDQDQRGSPSPDPAGAPCPGGPARHDRDHHTRHSRAGGKIRLFPYVGDKASRACQACGRCQMQSIAVRATPPRRPDPAGMGTRTEPPCPDPGRKRLRQIAPIIRRHLPPKVTGRDLVIRGRDNGALSLITRIVSCGNAIRRRADSYVLSLIVSQGNARLTAEIVLNEVFRLGRSRWVGSARWRSGVRPPGVRGLRLYRAGAEHGCPGRRGW